MSLDSLIEEVNGYVAALVKAGACVPKESDRNIYLRACWLLSQMKKSKVGEKHEGLRAFEKTLTESLPQLRVQS